MSEKHLSSFSAGPFYGNTKRDHRHSAHGRSASLWKGAAMIYSDKQYGVASARLNELRDAIHAARGALRNEEPNE